MVGLKDEFFRPFRPVGSRGMNLEDVGEDLIGELEGSFYADDSDWDGLDVQLHRTEEAWWDRILRKG